MEKTVRAALAEKCCAPADEARDFSKTGSIKNNKSRLGSFKACSDNGAEVILQRETTTTNQKNPNFIWESSCLSIVIWA